MVPNAIIRTNHIWSLLGSVNDSLLIGISQAQPGFCFESDLWFSPMAPKTRLQGGVRQERVARPSKEHEKDDTNDC